MLSLLFVQTIKLSFQNHDAGSLWQWRAALVPDQHLQRLSSSITSPSFPTASSPPTLSSGSPAVSLPSHSMSFSPSRELGERLHLPPHRYGHQSINPAILLVPPSTSAAVRWTLSSPLPHFPFPVVTQTCFRIIYPSLTKVTWNSTMGGEDGGNLKPAMHELLENEASCLELIGARVISDGSVANGTSFWIDADVFPQLLETNGFLSFFMAPKYSSPSSVFPYACPLDHSNHRRARAGLRLTCRICWPFILIEAVNLCLPCTSGIMAENKTCPTDLSCLGLFDHYLVSSPSIFTTPPIVRFRSTADLARPPKKKSRPCRGGQHGVWSPPWGRLRQRWAGYFYRGSCRMVIDG